MKPIVYSCSGCSNVAQMANEAAIILDRRGLAEMSCIAGVGGDVPALLKIAKSDRPKIAIDGCALACVKNVLARHGIEPELHYDLTKFGFKKRQHEDLGSDSTFDILGKIIQDAEAFLPTGEAA